MLAVGGLVAWRSCAGCFTFLQGYLAERASQGVAYDLRDALFAQHRAAVLQLLRPGADGPAAHPADQRRRAGAHLRGQRRGQIARRRRDAASARSSCSLYLNWQLALVALAAHARSCSCCLLRFVTQDRAAVRPGAVTLGRLNTVLQEDLAGVRVVRAFAREDYETERYRAVNDELLGQQPGRPCASSPNNFPFVFFFANLGTLVVVWSAGWR